MSGDWKCGKCGKINVEFIGTCECGGLKEDGIQTDENKIPDEQDKREEKRKWQCPECFKINDRDFCSCGYIRTGTDKYIEEKTDSDQPVAVNKSGTKKKKIRAAIIVAAIICVAIVVINVCLRSNNKAKVVEYDNSFGALIDMDFETFCHKFNKNVNKSYKENNLDYRFDITKHMNNFSEPYVYEDEGKEAKAYGVLVDGIYKFQIEMMDDKIYFISVHVDYGKMSMPDVLAENVIRTLSGLDLDESHEILIKIWDLKCVYKDGILYRLTEDSIMFFAASEEFVEELENLGNEVIYWD